MTGRESLELISAMIVDTRRRYHFEDGRLHLFWGYLDIAVALLVWGVAYFTQSVWANLLWWLVPVVGIPVSRLLSRKSGSKGYALSYTDRMISSMWRYVGFLSFAFALICLLFSFGGHPQVWMLMFFYSFLVVGMGTADAVLNERNYQESLLDWWPVPSSSRRPSPRVRCSRGGRCRCSLRAKRRCL